MSIISSWRKTFTFSTVLLLSIGLSANFRTSNISKNHNDHPKYISDHSPIIGEDDSDSEDSSYHYPDLTFPFGDFGQILFPALITAYLFLCLTLMCDCFLIPCVQIISTKLQLSHDVAGATLMAAASSSPELFVNILSTFLTGSDVGVTTILGAGLFALMVVPALIIFCSDKMLRLDYWPATREIFFYLVALILLTLVIEDNRVEWYEATYLIAIYLFYLLFLRFNSKLRYYFELAVAACRRGWCCSNEFDEQLWPILQKPAVTCSVSMSVEDVFSVLEDHNPEFYTMGGWPSDCGFLTKIQWILMWPIITVFRYTIPTFWTGRFHNFFWLTFVICVAWIGVLSYGISWMITDIGEKTSVPDTVMALTLLAAGISIPETISGVIVAKQGYGTMAFSNALGSNTFAILLCLGIPWLIKTLCFPRKDGNYLLINSQSVRYFGSVAFIALLITFAIFVVNKFRVKNKVGWIFLLMYVIALLSCIYAQLSYYD